MSWRTFLCFWNAFTPGRPQDYGVEEEEEKGGGGGKVDLTGSIEGNVVSFKVHLFSN